MQVRRSKSSTSKLAEPFFWYYISLFVEQTDTVCVIGIVKIKVAGPVQNGERIYASFENAGVGIPETQIPLRPSGGVSPILLGQALESSHTSKLDAVHPVKCFVSVVLGIQSREVGDAVDNIQRHMQRKIADTIKNEKKKFYKGMVFAITFYNSIFCLLLGLVLWGGVGICWLLSSPVNHEICLWKLIYSLLFVKNFILFSFLNFKDSFGRDQSFSYSCLFSST